MTSRNSKMLKQLASHLQQGPKAISKEMLNTGKREVKETQRYTQEKQQKKVVKERRREIKRRLLPDVSTGPNILCSILTMHLSKLLICGKRLPRGFILGVILKQEMAKEFQKKSNRHFQRHEPYSHFLFFFEDNDFKTLKFTIEDELLRVLHSGDLPASFYDDSSLDFHLVLLYSEKLISSLYLSVVFDRFFYFKLKRERNIEDTTIFSELMFSFCEFFILNLTKETAFSLFLIRNLDFSCKNSVDKYYDLLTRKLNRKSALILLHEFQYVARKNPNLFCFPRLDDSDFLGKNIRTTFRQAIQVLLEKKNLFLKFSKPTGFSKYRSMEPKKTDNKSFKFLFKERNIKPAPEIENEETRLLMREIESTEKEDSTVMKRNVSNIRSSKTQSESTPAVDVESKERSSLKLDKFMRIKTNKKNMTITSISQPLDKNLKENKPIGKKKTGKKELKNFPRTIPKITRKPALVLQQSVVTPREHLAMNQKKGLSLLKNNKYIPMKKRKRTLTQILEPRLHITKEQDNNEDKKLDTSDIATLELEDEIYKPPTCMLSKSHQQKEEVSEATPVDTLSEVDEEVHVSASHLSPESIEQQIEENLTDDEIAFVPSEEFSVSSLEEPVLDPEHGLTSKKFWELALTEPQRMYIFNKEKEIDLTGAKLTFFQYIEYNNKIKINKLASKLGIEIEALEKFLSLRKTSEQWEEIFKNRKKKSKEERKIIFQRYLGKENEKIILNELNYRVNIYGHLDKVE
eukprot:snap_masked-scaffold_7-processed-gene-17.26-mRNA-1 protein AED:1.00 eAED:1.00 QI:0/0/0/0/1/1/2/0/744